MRDFMRQTFSIALLALAACATSPPPADLAAFDKVGGANWTFVDGEARASSGSAIGFLVSKESFRDFELSAEVFVGDPHNSGIFVRCADRAAITATSCYEANIFDKRPDQSGRTGAVPGYFTPPLAQVDAANRWTAMTVRAVGARITITLNGIKTVDADGPLLNEGPIALQWGEGDVRFRNVRVKRLG
jgi:hypothetical protein